MPPSPSQRIIDHDNTFFRGAKSDSDPSQIPMGYFWMGINVINTGGVVSCRPGQRCIVTLPDGNLQGGFIFRPLAGMEQYLVVIDGFVYVADYPFTNFRRLPGIQMSPSARQVYWAQTVQAAERIGTGVAPAIRVITPRAVVFIQDGGLSAPAWYDGAESGQATGDPYGTPVGGPMAWVGDRLWLANGHQVFASDIANPFSFREQVYLGGQSSFFFRSEVTGMQVTPSTEAPQLMVFTETSGSILQANVRDRDLWNTTLNFQEEVIGVGCTSNRSIVAHYGRLCWFSPAGIAFYDPATSGKLTTRLPARDNEMMYSKAVLDENLSKVAAAGFGQFLLMSVPAEDVYNRHTWVLNHASLATLDDESGPSWCGYWLGTRPVEWATGTVASADRIYHVSVDYDGKNRLWESFLTDRLDNKCPITWALFTRGYFGASAAIQEKGPGVRCRLAWVDIALSGIEEDLNLGVFYAGGTRGSFRRMLTRLLAISKGSLAFDQQLSATSRVFAFKAQSRTIRTEDANQQTPNDEKGSCHAETDEIDNIDRSFQLLIVGHGPATIRWIRPFAFLVPEDLSGDAVACEDEPPYNAVRFDGVGTDDTTFAGVAAELAVAPMDFFTAIDTQIVYQGGMQMTGVGMAESIVSQDAANRVAKIIATKMAENDLTQALPKYLSVGLGL